MSMNKSELSAPCEDCGAAPGTYCSPICLQDSKNPADTGMTWSTARSPSRGKYIVSVVQGRGWVDLGEFNTRKEATDALEACPFKGCQAIITQATKQIWRKESI